VNVSVLFDSNPTTDLFGYPGEFYKTSFFAMGYLSERVPTGSRGASSSVSWPPFAPQKNRGCGYWSQLCNFFAGNAKPRQIKNAILSAV